MCDFWMHGVFSTSTPSQRLTAEFTTFMRAYQDMVFSTAVRLTGDAATAEDIAQDVFIKAYQSFDMLRESPSPGGWLKTVTRNLTLNHLSRHRSRWRFFADLAPAGKDGGGDRALVEQALKQLPQHQRVPLVLYHFEDMPYQEIAQHLRVSLPKVKTDILRARAALAKILATVGEAREAIAE